MFLPPQGADRFISVPTGLTIEFACEMMEVTDLRAGPLLADPDLSPQVRAGRQAQRGGALVGAVRGPPQQLGRRDGGGWQRVGLARSHCRFAPHSILFMPDPRRDSVRHFLKRHCDRALGTGWRALRVGCCGFSARRLPSMAGAAPRTSRTCTTPPPHSPPNRSSSGSR
jgi:hypothetical protein